MSWKPKFYIIYPLKMIDEIRNPDASEYLCAGNLSETLQEVLNVKAIGSEIKLIWNNQHRWQIIKDYDLQPEDLDDYIKSNCSILSFKTEYVMKRAYRILHLMGAKSKIKCVENYRDVILNQANFKRNGEFITEIPKY